MPPLKKYLNRKLNFMQSALVIVIIAGLAGLGCLAERFVAAKLLEARVRVALPGVVEALRQQEKTIVSGIEAYHQHFGSYPPDHVLRRQPLTVDVVNNPLLYELVGVVLDPTNQLFVLPGLESAEAAYVKEFFHCDGFKNCAERQEKVQHFLPADRITVRQLHDDPDVFVLGPAWPTGEVNVDADVLYGIEISPWRYVSSAPTNNPGRFDLWIEINANGKKTTIGNWMSVK